MSQKEYSGRMTPGLFWGVDEAEMNLDSCPAQVVQRMLEHGEQNDWRAIHVLYFVCKSTIIIANKDGFVVVSSI